MKKKLLLASLLLAIATTSLSAVRTIEFTDQFGEKTGKTFLYLEPETKGKLVQDGAIGLTKDAIEIYIMTDSDFDSEADSDGVVLVKNFGEVKGTIRITDTDIIFLPEAKSVPKLIKFMKKSRSFVYVGQNDESHQPTVIDLKGFTKQYNALK